MLTCEKYKMFHGTMRITPLTEIQPFEITADWLYKPDTGCWYGDGRSFEADVCTVVLDGWTPVGERLPQKDCLVFEANKGRILLACAVELEADDWNVTHWMPLPKLPGEAHDVEPNR